MPLGSCLPRRTSRNHPRNTRNPADSPASLSWSHHAPFSAPTHVRNTQAENRISGTAAVKLRWDRAVAIATYPPAVAPPCPWRRRTPPARDARQDDQDGRVDGADEHRSRRVAHCQIVRQRIRLKIRGRSPADVAQHLLLQHLDINRRDVDRLEKTPATTSLAASLSALACKPPANTSRARQGGWKGILDAQTPD